MLLETPEPPSPPPEFQSKQLKLYVRSVSPSCLVWGIGVGTEGAPSGTHNPRNMLSSKGEYISLNTYT